MGGDVYADLLFLVNFSMDYLCAYLTAATLRRRAVPGRLLCASAVGGVYAVAALFLPSGQMTSLVADVLVCLVMCVILFYARGVPVRFFCAACALFVGISMAMGGMMTALFNLLNRIEWPTEAIGNSEDGLSAWVFAILAGFSTLAGLKGSRLLHRSAARRYARLSVSVGGRTVELQALLDSGNMCRDPLSGRSVIFIDPIPARALIGAGEEKDPDMARRLRLIPVETVSGRRLQKAYLPDRAVLTDSGGAHVLDVLIAPTESMRGAGVYQAIVSAELAL
jgi:sigma-E processing peptidase SpoIIGA